MIKKLRNTAVKMVGVIAMLAVTLRTKIALAEGEGGIGIPTNITPETFGQKVVNLVSSYGTHIGGAIVVCAILFGGLKLTTQAYKAEERARTMGGLFYVLIAAILIGGCLFFAGMFMGIGNEFKS